VEFLWLLTDENEPAPLVHYCFAWMVAIGHRGTGRTVHPKRVEFQRPESHRKIYESHFQCPVKFSARCNLLVFDEADVDRPFLTHNAELLGLVAPQLDHELTLQLAQKSLAEQVRNFWQANGRLCGDVARELCLRPRTLQRRLTAECAKFQQLMEEARGELAQRYLLHSSLELNETAYLLGAFQGVGGQVAR
jgi:hypothetical protein